MMCGVCNTTYTHEEVIGKGLNGFIKFYRLNGKDVCEGCTIDENDETPHITPRIKTKNRTKE